MYDQTHYNNKERAVPREATQASVAYAGIPEIEQTFLRELPRAVWKRLWVVVLVTLVFVGAAVGFNLWQTPVYGASVKILVGQKAEGDQSSNLSGTVQGLEQLTQTMVEAINSRPVAEEVIRRLELRMTPGDLLGNLTIEQIETTQFIQLYYQDEDPQRAQKVVNTLADVSSERIAQASASANDITATVWEYATVPDAPVSPDPVRNGLVALGLGLMFGVGLAFLLEYLDDSWRSPEEVALVSGIPTFGAIPRFETAKRKQRIPG
jgi:capsular polysaccharide biosynthesis protein